MARTMTGRTEASWLVPATALGTVLLLDILRVWMPSVIFIYGRAGSTPATEMGAFAFAWVVAGVLLAATARRLGPRSLALAAAAVLALARLALQVTEGGDAQLTVASIGWVAAMAWAAGLVSGAPSRREVAGGVAIGLAGDAALRAAGHSVEVLWIDGLVGLAVGVLLVAGFAVAAWRSRELPGWARRGERGGGPAWPWLALGPVLVLHGVVAGTPARASVAVGLAPGLAAALVVAGLAVGVAWATASVALPALPSAVAAAALLIVGTVLALPADGWLAVVGQVVLAVGLGGTLGLLPRADGRSGPTRRATATAVSLLLLFTVGFLYYASYDISLGIGNRAALTGTAVLAGVVAVLAGMRARPAAPLATGPLLAGGAASLVALAAVGAWVGSGTSPAEPGAGFPVRAVLYNVHMGYDTRGRFDTGALAAVLADQDPDVVVLNEVDRGWFLNGSHDVLQLIAEELDLPFVFAPAADEVWGNAILSRYPLSDVAWERLPRGDVPMERSVLSAVAALPDGSELGVVATHLHHVEGEGDVRRPQAEVVAGVAADLAAGRPVVVMGDMNAEPGAPELAPYTDVGLEDAVTPLGDVLTFPSWDPDEHIDHVFTTPDLTASDLAVPRSEASDHLSVAVTLARR